LLDILAFEVPLEFGCRWNASESRAGLTCFDNSGCDRDIRRNSLLTLTVTAGPAGVVVYKTDVVVDALVVLVLTLVARVVVLRVTTTEGEGAVNCYKIVEVLLSVIALSFRAEVDIEI